MKFSIVNFKEIRRSVFGERLDAEFYLPKYLAVDENIEGNYISKQANYSSDITLGKNNVLGGIPFSFYKLN